MQESPRGEGGAFYGESLVNHSAIPNGSYTGSAEGELRRRFGVPALDVPRVDRLRHLAAFWQHFSLHRRSCARTGESIISVFSSSCPYPVWKRAVWLESAEPPSAEYDPGRPMFEQLWNLFRTCPIPHNVGLGNENCDYTDDWWESRNCYLCHSGLRCEDLRHCYRTIRCTDSQRLVFAFDSQLCSELINCFSCFRVHHALNCRDCKDSAFLFDCRNCSDCILCWNLRNKQYCVNNAQLSREAFLEQRDKLTLDSRATFDNLKNQFQLGLRQTAWWRATEIDRSENASGAYLDEVKNVEHCFFVQHAEDCCNCLRGYQLKDALDAVGCGIKTERIYSSVNVNENSYEIRCCFNVTRSSYLEYCGFCINCKNCFGCCGLVGKEYCILNKQYPRAEYESFLALVKSHVTREGMAGKFFPPHFAASPYNESLAGYFFPLSDEQIIEDGFRANNELPMDMNGCLPASAVPDRPGEATPETYTSQFWDENAKRRFQVSQQDVQLAAHLGIPLPNAYYAQDIKTLYRWMLFDGTQREGKCAKTGKRVLTHLPKWLDSRLLSNETYEQLYY